MICTELALDFGLNGMLCRLLMLSLYLLQATPALCPKRLISLDFEHCALQIGPTSQFQLSMHMGIQGNTRASLTWLVRVLIGSFLGVSRINLVWKVSHFHCLL